MNFTGGFVGEVGASLSSSAALSSALVWLRELYHSSARSLSLRTVGGKSMMDAPGASR